MRWRSNHSRQGLDLAIRHKRVKQIAVGLGNEINLATSISVKPSSQPSIFEVAGSVAISSILGYSGYYEVWINQTDKDILVDDNLQVKNNLSVKRSNMKIEDFVPKMETLQNDINGECSAILRSTKDCAFPLNLIYLKLADECIYIRRLDKQGYINTRYAQTLEMSTLNYIAFTEMIPSQINNRCMIQKACNIFSDRIETLSTAVDNSKKMSTQVFDVMRPTQARPAG